MSERNEAFFPRFTASDQFKELGLPGTFVQFNHSGSQKGTVRGLHFQWDPPMGKLMRVTGRGSLSRGCQYAKKLSHAGTLVWYTIVFDGHEDDLGSCLFRQGLLRSERLHGDTVFHYRRVQQ